MRRLAVIGIGTGNPDHLTIEGINAIKSADVIFLTDKGDSAAELLHLRKEICDRFASDARRLVEFSDPERDRAPSHYVSAVEAWHEKRRIVYEQLISQQLAENERGAFLAWGDPSLYDSILRIMDAVARRQRSAFEYEVIPGISSLQVLAAHHRIPLNRISEPVLITTGRRLGEMIDAGITLEQDVLVMLDGDCTFSRIPDGDTEIYWGAYLGMSGELLVEGKLRDVTRRIQTLRSDARVKRGWIMDTYLLRPPSAP
jgi:precorrin-6A synthase